MRIPIACTLTAADARDRVEAWRAFLSEEVVAARRDGDVLRLALAPDDRSLLRAVDLAAREKACCGFFTFAIAIEADRRWLEVAVPPEAAGILGDFAGLLPPSLLP